ncbi:MAG: hypothetical protein M1839_004202 [Geoglossum umbratile]|nr:MAG: hypothetical protein M1839_004202 [Geoglossum umbratile]
MPCKELRLLALDGGGIRGLSSLYVLKRIMETINPETPPKPCEYFDMICGTSTGGLSAIMLGRLQMTIDACIDAYVLLSDRVFQKKRQRVSMGSRVQGRFDTEELERAVKATITRQGFEEDVLLKDSPNAKCKVSPRWPSDLFDVITVWQAARATSAASSFFGPMAVGRHDEEFVDGAPGANNPIYHLWNEAQDVWDTGPLEDNIKCLISVGTGIPLLTPFGDDAAEVYRALDDIANETEKTAEKFIRDKRQLSDGRYYRFNVEKGLEGIGLEETHQAKIVAAATRRYLASQQVFSNLHLLAKHNGAWDRCSHYAQEARVAYDAEEYTEAIWLFQKALQGLDDRESDNDGIADARKTYAQALYLVGQFDKASDEFEKAVSWAERNFGPDHTETLKLHVSLGHVLGKCRRIIAARRQFELAVSGHERASRAADSLRCRYHLGMMLADHEPYDRDWLYWPDAEMNLRRASQGLARLPSAASSNEALDAQIGYAKVLLHMCRELDAIRQFTEAKCMAQRRGLPASHDNMQVIARGVRECEFWLGQPANVRDGDRRNVTRLDEQSWREVTGHW